MKSLWRILGLTAGLAFFGWSLSQVGLNQVWQALQQLGPVALLALLPYLAVYFVDCFAWVQTLPRHEIPFLTLLRIRWAGESVNNVIPSAYIGGEAVKVCLLRRHGISTADGAASAVVSKTAQSVSQLAFVLMASVFLLALAQNQPGLRAGLACLTLGGLAAIGTLFWVQRAGLFRTVFALLRILRWRPGFLEERQTKLLQLDVTILDFYRAHPRRFYASTVVYFGGWLLDSLEVYVVAHLVGMPISWIQALIVEAFTGLAKALGMWIPGSLGVQESGIVLAGRLAGLPDTLSATYALLRRAREVIFAAAGLGFLFAADALREARPAHAVTP